jgi:Cof subfamily protein (haloacid dehalogenase superfamily)
MEKGLASFALTDHDTVLGVAEAIAYAKELRERGAAAPEVVPGIEFSTAYTIGGKVHDIHILGLAIDYQAVDFDDKLSEVLDSRTARNKRMCQKLTEAGMPVVYEELEAGYSDCVITRVHFARYMIEKGYVSSIREAFERYIGDGCQCYLPRKKVSSAQAIDMILEADGIPVLAHPFLYHLEMDQIDTLVADLTNEGLLGIEGIYSTHTLYQEQVVRKLAGKYSLLLSGGSDFHGSAKPMIDMGSGKGHLVVPEDIWLRIRDVKQHKVLFTDLDGTLLRTGSTISDDLRDGLQKVAMAGHRIVLSSGRMLRSVLNVRDSLGIAFPNMYVVANNGALAYDCDKGMKLSGCDIKLGQEDIRHIVGEADRFGLHIQGYTDTAIVCRKWDDELRYYTGFQALDVQLVEDIADFLAEGSYKLLLLHLTDRSRLEAFRDHILTFCGDRIQLVFSNDKYLEVLPGEAGKGNALAFMQRYLHMPHSHTVAVGDEENDISMIQKASVGVAMVNAPEVVKQSADWITTRDNNHDGMLEVLERWFI